MTKLRKWYAFAGRYPFENPKHTLRVSPATCWRHTVFQHFNIVDIKHHRFIVTSITHVLLFNKPLQLVDWVVQFTEPVSKLAPGNYWLEALDSMFVFWICFREWTNKFRRIDEPYWSGYVFTNILPKLIDTARQIFSLLNFKIMLF